MLRRPSSISEQSFSRLVALGRAYRADILRSAEDPAVRGSIGRVADDAMTWADAVIDAARRGRRTGERCDFAVLNARHRFIGAISLRLRTPTNAELAYWIDARNRRVGHATAAILCISHFALEALGLRDLTARVAPENLASRNLLTKIGFSTQADDEYRLKLRELRATGPEGGTVLVIRRSQHEALRAEIELRFVRDVVARIVERFPRVQEGTTLQALEAHAHASVTRARALAFEEARDLSAFIELALLVSPRFDEHPVIASELRGEGKPDRMQKLLLTIPRPIWDEARDLGRAT